MVALIDAHPWAITLLVFVLLPASLWVAGRAWAGLATSDELRGLSVRLLQHEAEDRVLHARSDADTQALRQQLQALPTSRDLQELRLVLVEAIGDLKGELRARAEIDRAQDANLTRLLRQVERHGAILAEAAFDHT